MEQQIGSQEEPRAFINAIHGFRYQVKDVARAVAFYTQRLGFTLKHQQLPACANVSLGGADLRLSGPGASGSRPLPSAIPIAEMKELISIWPTGSRLAREPPTNTAR